MYRVLQNKLRCSIAKERCAQLQLFDESLPGTDRKFADPVDHLSHRAIMAKYVVVLSGK